MIVRDLKIYSLVLDHAKLFEDLRFKISNFFLSSPENTPEGFHVLTYWTPYLIVLSDLSLLNYEVLLYKDSLVLNPDKSFALYNNDPEGPLFSNSSELLHSFLLKLHKGWSFVPEILQSLSIKPKYQIDILEQKLLRYWLKLIPVLKECICILYSWQMVIAFSPPYFSNSTEYYSFLHKLPSLISDSNNKRLVNCDREYWILAIIADVCLRKDFMLVSMTILREDLEYKHRIKENLSYKQVLEFVLEDILLNLDIETLRFLGLNKLKHFVVMQGLIEERKII